MNHNLNENKSKIIIDVAAVLSILWIVMEIYYYYDFLVVKHYIRDYANNSVYNLNFYLLSFIVLSILLRLSGLIKYLKNVQDGRNEYYIGQLMAIGISFHYIDKTALWLVIFSIQIILIILIVYMDKELLNFTINKKQKIILFSLVTIASLLCNADMYEFVYYLPNSVDDFLLLMKLIKLIAAIFSFYGLLIIFYRNKVYGFHFFFIGQIIYFLFYAFYLIQFIRTIPDLNTEEDFKWIINFIYLVVTLLLISLAFLFYKQRYFPKGIKSEN